MKTWWHRAVGAVGVAGGLVLLGGTAANAAPPGAPQPVTGAVGNLLEPASGLLGPLGAAPSNVLPGPDAVPGVVNGPVIVPAGPQRPAQQPGTQPRNHTDGEPTVPAAGAPVPVLGDLLSGGDLLGAGVLPDELISGGSVPSADQLPVILGDRMATQQPELFSSGLPFLGGLDGLPIISGGPGTMPQGGTPVADVPAAHQGTGAKPADGRAFSDGRPIAGVEPGFG